MIHICAHMHTQRKPACSRQAQVVCPLSSAASSLGSPPAPSMRQAFRLACQIAKHHNVHLLDVMLPHSTSTRAQAHALTCAGSSRSPMPMGAQPLSSHSTVCRLPNNPRTFPLKKQSRSQDRTGQERTGSSSVVLQNPTGSNGQQEARPGHPWGMRKLSPGLPCARRAPPDAGVKHHLTLSSVVGICNQHCC